MMPTFSNPEARNALENAILTRVDQGRTAYIADATRKRAALALQERGLVICTEGTGQDVGILIVRRAPSFCRPGPGGAAA